MGGSRWRVCYQRGLPRVVFVELRCTLFFLLINPYRRMVEKCALFSFPHLYLFDSTGENSSVLGVERVMYLEQRVRLQRSVSFVCLAVQCSAVQWCSLVRCNIYGSVQYSAPSMCGIETSSRECSADRGPRLSGLLPLVWPPPTGLASLVWPLVLPMSAGLLPSLAGLASIKRLVWSRTKLISPPKQSWESTGIFQFKVWSIQAWSGEMIL